MMLICEQFNDFLFLSCISGREKTSYRSSSAWYGRLAETLLSLLNSLDPLADRYCLIYTDRALLLHVEMGDIPSSKYRGIMTDGITSQNACSVVCVVLVAHYVIKLE